MSKSFDDKIREKLSGYRATPPADAKKAIVGVHGESQVLPVFYQTTGIVLLVIALFMFGYRQGQLSIEPKGILTKEIVVNAPKNQDHLVVIEIPEKSKKSSPVSSENKIEKLPLQADATAAVEPEIELHFTEYDVDGLREPDLEFENSENERKLYPLYFKRKRGVVPKESKFFKSYFETGAFFLYNRLVPNLNDEVYVGNYDAPFSLSTARLGASLVAGLEKDWTERLNTRFGLVFNNYNQHFSFTVRHTKPDSIMVGADYIEPVFNEQNIQIRKRVSTLGLRVQNTWAFPSKYNSLYLSAEYHRRVGQGAQFQFDGKTHQLSAPDMWMVEFGLRKQLLSFRSGDLFVVPGIRYSISRIKEQGILNVRPFSAGVSLSYTLK